LYAYLKGGQANQGMVVILR